MLKQPDYSGLVTLLPKLRRLVDAAGKVMLEPHEVEQIRALGFQAQPGTWVVPRLPGELVAGNPLFEFLGGDVDPFWRPSSGVSHEVPEIAIPDRPTTESLDAFDLMAQNAQAPSGNPSSSTAAQACHGATQIPDLAGDQALEKELTAILEAVERAGGSLPRRSLQKKLWRIKAEQFNRAIELLRVRGVIQVEGKVLVTQAARPASPQFHAVPQPDNDFPQVELPVGPDQGAGPFNGFRGAPLNALSTARKVIENAN